MSVLDIIIFVASFFAGCISIVTLIGLRVYMEVKGHSYDVVPWGFVFALCFVSLIPILNFVVFVGVSGFLLGTLWDHFQMEDLVNNFVRKLFGK